MQFFSIWVIWTHDSCIQFNLYATVINVLFQQTLFPIPVSYCVWAPVVTYRFCFVQMMTVTVATLVPAHHWSHWWALFFLTVFRLVKCFWLPANLENAYCQTDVTASPQHWRQMCLPLDPAQRSGTTGDWTRSTFQKWSHISDFKINSSGRVWDWLF